MNAHRVETVVGRDRTVVIEDLPFQAGDAVVVTVSHCLSECNERDRYPLRDTPIKYIDPTEPVASGAWGISG